MPLFQTRWRYHLLPTDSKGSRIPTWRNVLFRRPITTLISVLLVITFALLTLLTLSKPVANDAVVLAEDWRDFPQPKFPPLYEDVYEYERNLPQHNESLPFPEGADGRYLYQSSHAWGAGWNNAFQELLFQSHLAFATQRAFVFDPYTWNPDPLQNYTEYNGHLIPSRIPLNALVSGPLAGAAFPDDNPNPRSVTKEYFEKVCPNPTILSGDDVPDAVDSTDANFIMQKWIEKLQNTEDRCVKLQGNHAQIFPYFIFGYETLTETWSWFSKSPIVTHFAWSRLATSAMEANLAFIKPIETFFDRLVSMFNSFMWGEKQGIYSQINGLLVLHVRRGDYAEHCVNLANWGALWMGWNTFPEFTDKLVLPTGQNVTEERHVIYMERCWPTQEQIVAKVSAVLKTREAWGIRRIYVMTNAKVEWAAELRGKLMAINGLETVTTSRDLRLSWTQKFVSHALDMFIGQRAQVFIGNGWSSMTANVVMLRMARGVQPGTNRFW
ncbi:hypothetical protein BD410DRAFT_836268 [Rickenella mellea]|uniref:Uncharacterized protein n=1 Tax=Rickenella mellea TaxID=50990 RepID=A0A4Y7QGP5_9AGAM|nr:hypothetical protein BD410DRAFT_836268 [Rickenella mellea]